jgi:triosephosphate isomerase (TIM)
MHTDYPPLIIGNWKMNGNIASALALAKKILDAHGSSNFDIVLCPPAPLIGVLAPLLKNSSVVLGGQDCHYEASGAFTGDISPVMLKEFACRYVILGHSERRCYHKESNALIRKKTMAAHAAGLITVICVGECAEDREAGNVFSILRKQLSGSVPQGVLPENTVIAYEPVWAIGTGNIPQIAEITEIHDFIAAFMRDNHGASFRILYGGSVKPANAAEILSIRNVAGLLVGGCSLSADDFGKINDIASKQTTFTQVRRA